MTNPIRTITNSLGPLGLVALLLLVIALGLPSTATAQDWESTEWAVLCSSKLIRTLPAEDCNDESVTGPAAVTRAGLEDASRWLKRLGFRGPDVERLAGRGMPYKAYISDEKNQESYGVYYPYRRKLYLNSGYYFAIGEGGTQKEQARDLALNTPKVGSMVHELFHAVEHSYHQGEIYGSETREWIWEGMADAVMMAWLKKRHAGLQASGHARSYDYPLHHPKDEYGAYRTHHFWTKLGEMLNSTDHVQYLDQLLRQDLEAHRGLEGIHEGLTQWNPKGLYDLYPEFIRRYVQQEVFFEKTHQKSLRFTEARVEDSQAGTAQPMAASAHRLTVQVPKWETAGLEIRLKDDHEDLHLIVDERRLDKSRALSPGADRNVFRTAITGRAQPREFFVRVANVARDPADSQERNYTLEFTLEPQDVCSSPVMMAAVHPRAQTLTPMQKEELPRSIAKDFVILPAEEYEQASEAQPGLHPAQGRIEISGLVSDGGLGCTDPLGTNPTLKIATGTPGEKRQAAQEMAREMAERMKNLSREEMKRLMQRRSQGEKSLSALMRPDDAEDASDALILVYSPNGVGWQRGVPAVLPMGDISPVQHGGLGGWHSNAAAGIGLRLSGTSPRELREDSAYTAHLVRLNIASPSGETIPIYNRWQGEERKATCPLFAGEWQFEGWTEQLMAGPMKGTVTVEEITGAEVRGTFELSGTGVLFRQEYAFVQNGGGELCETKSLLSTDGPWDFGMKAISRGPIRISGTFSAPASVETTRSRFIQHTATVQ